MAAMDVEKEIFDDAEDALPEEFNHMTAEAINQRGRLLDNEIRVLKDESTRLSLEQNSMKEKIKENKEKIKLNNQLPYLVGNIVEVLDIKPDEDEEEDGAAVDLDSQRQACPHPARAAWPPIWGGTNRPVDQRCQQRPRPICPACSAPPAAAPPAHAPAPPPPSGAGQVRGAEDQHPANHLPASGGAGGCRHPQARRFSGRQQGE